MRPRFLAALLGAALSVTSVSAHAQAPINPYNRNVAVPACVYNPYIEQQSCSANPLANSYVMRSVIGETTLGTLDHEKGWLILVNLEDQPQRTVTEFIVPWSSTPYLLDVTLRPKERFSFELNADPLFWDPDNNFIVRFASVFTTTVYFERSGYAQTTVRPGGDMWSKEFINTGIVVPRASEPAADAYGMRAVIGETTLGTPDHEKGWLILVNLEDQPQRATAEVIVPWSATPFLLDVTLQPKERYSFELHADPFFQDPQNTLRVRFPAVLTTTVYFQRSGYAQTTVRPGGDMWSKEFISAGVVIPRPTSTSGMTASAGTH